jgi:peptidoglycan/LPS O-acetylase OafA/YrhL
VAELEPLAASEPTARNHALDGLRGWAAVIVVFFHSVLAMDARPWVKILYTEIWRLQRGDESIKIIASLINGQTAVSLFFLLSGAVLFRSLERGKLRLLTFLTWPLQRALRIYPGLISALLLAWLVTWTMAANWPATFRSPPMLPELLSNMALFSYSVLGLTYTLQAEMLAIPFFLVAAVLIAWNGPIGSAIVLGSAIVVSFYPLPVVPPFFSQFLIFFALGIFVTGSAGILAARVLAPVWPLTLFGFLFVRAFFYYWAPGSLIAQGAFGFFLLSIAYHGRTSLNALMETRLSQFLGRISYSLYLINVPFLWIFLKLVTVQPALTSHPVLAGSAIALVLLAISIPLAWLNERYVERPGVRLGRKLRDWLLRSENRQTVAA